MPAREVADGVLVIFGGALLLTPGFLSDIVGLLFLLPPTRAAIIMTMEPVFAASFAVWLGGESATLRMLVGGGLVLAAMFAVELLARRRPGELPVEVLHHEV